MAYLSYTTLADKGACYPGRKDFRSYFGNGVEVTEELCLKYADVFDWTWAGTWLLNGASEREFFDIERVAGVKRVDGYRASHMNGTCDGCDEATHEYEETLARAFARLYTGEFS